MFVDDIKDPDMYAMLSFTTMDGQSNLAKSSRYDSSCNPSPLLMIDTTKCDSAIVARGFIMACDSSLSKTDAQEVVTNLANSVEGNSGSICPVEAGVGVSAHRRNSKPEFRSQRAYLL